MIRITATLEGATEMSRKLGAVDKQLKDFTTPLAASADLLLNTADQNFDARGGLMGGWAPRTRPYPHPLLEKTGTMRGAFYKKPINNFGIEVGNRDFKFRYHQSRATRKRLPRRIMLMIIARDKRAIVKEFQKHMADALGRRA